MKLLFATEVFPMRNSFTEHSLVSREFLKNIIKLLKSENDKVLDARLLCNTPTFDMLVRDNTRTLPSFIRMKEDTSKLLEGMLQDWNGDGLELWKEYVSGEGESAQIILDELEYIFNEVYQFNMLVCWGENGVYDKFARKHNIPCLHLELASTRSPFPEGRIADLCGSNGSASIRNLKFNELEKLISAPSYHFWPAYLNISGESEPNILGFDDASSTYWNDDITLNLNKNNKVALIGLQLFDDANTQRHSKFESPLEFLQDVIPDLIDNNWNVIVKTHPGAIYRPINYLRQNEAIAYAKTFENCYVYDHENTHRDYISLLKMVDLVVTINSSLAFEAAMLGKVSVILGDSLYKVKDVFPNLSDVLSDSFNKSEYLRKISTLIYFYNKFVFLERESYESYDIYLAYYDFWEENKEKLYQGDFSVESYINHFDSLSRLFLLDKKKNIRIDEYKSLVSSYLFNLPKKDEPLILKDEYLLFEKSKLKVKLKNNLSLYSIDSSSFTKNEFLIEGWSVHKESKIPPIFVIIIMDEKIHHCGRVAIQRGDVKDYLNITNSHVGFKFKNEVSSDIKEVSLLFIYSDNSSELIKIN